MNLRNERDTYKPFAYPWAVDAWLQQQRTHWLPEEVPLSEDLKQWRIELTKSEKNLLTHLFRYFTQSEVDIWKGYVYKYTKVFRAPEIGMMLNAFANMETVHAWGYSYLIDSLGLPETEYEKFLEHKEMQDKRKTWEICGTESNLDIALSLASYGAFTEGMQMFSAFAILLNFQRFNKMKGMCQIVAWTLRDETLHAQSIIKLFHVFVKENLSKAERAELSRQIQTQCEKMVSEEELFIDLAFEDGDMEGLTKDDVKHYLRFIANQRMEQLGEHAKFLGIDTHPLDWLPAMQNGLEHTNFFENRSTAYSKAATKGNWDDAFAF